MNVISFAMTAGIFMTFMAPLFLLSGLINFEITIMILYLGIGVTLYSYFFLTRARRRFFRYLREIFEKTIIKSKDYEDFATDLRSRTARIMSKIGKREHMLALRERDLREKEMELSELEKQLDNVKKELSLEKEKLKKKKRILRKKIT